MRQGRLFFAACVLFLAGAVALMRGQGPVSSSPAVIQTPVSIAQGGTGQATATLGFNALSPVTTRGDLIVRDATNNVRLAKGTAGQFLSIGANDPVWAAVPGWTALLGSGGTWNPGDALTYTIGTLFGFVPSAGDVTPGVWIPVGSTLRSVYVRVTVAGTLGSNDGAASQSSVIIRKNATTDISTITSTLQLTAVTADFNATGLSVAVSAGDNVYIKFVGGTWTTNPTVVILNATLYFDVP